MGGLKVGEEPPPVVRLLAVRCRGPITRMTQTQVNAKKRVWGATARQCLAHAGGAGSFPCGDSSSRRHLAMLRSCGESSRSSASSAQHNTKTNLTMKTEKLKNRILLSSFTLLALVAGAQVLHAGSHTWSGAVNNSWSNDGNWSSGGAPQFGEANITLVFP